MKLFRMMLLIALSADLVTTAAADHRQQLFEQGNQAFQKGDYAQAVASFEEIHRLGFESAALYYNLGNAYYKLGQNARAILNYERALRLQPNDEDLRFNLQLANLTVVDKIPVLPELFYIRYFQDFRALFGLRTLTAFTLCLYLFFFIALISWLLLPAARLRRFALSAGVVLAVLLMIFSFTMVSKILFLRHNVEAVVMSAKVDVRSAPSADGTEIFTIHEGLKVKISNRNGGWYEIRLPDGKVGWLLAKEIEVI